MSTIFRDLKTYNTTANEVQANRKVLHKDIQRIKASVKSTNKKTQVQMPKIRNCAKHMIALDEKITKLENFYKDHKVIHFFTNKCLGRFSTLNKAIRERNLFTKVAPDDFKSDVNAKINKLTPKKKAKKIKVDPKKSEDKAPSSHKPAEVSQPEDKAPSSHKSAEVSQPQDKAPEGSKSGGTAQSGKKSQVEDEASSSSDSEETAGTHDGTSSSSSSSLSEVIIDVDAEPVAPQPFTRKAFAKEVARLFPKEQQDEAKKLAGKAAKKSFPSDVNPLIDKVASLIEENRSLRLSPNKSINRQFMNALVTLDEPEVFIMEGPDGSNTITNPKFADEHTRSKAAFLKNKGVIESIVQKVNDSREDEDTVFNIFSNLTTIKAAIKENKIGLTFSRWDWQPRIATSGLNYLKIQDIADAITEDQKTFNARFGLTGLYDAPAPKQTPPSSPKADRVEVKSDADIKAESVGQGE